MPEPSQTVRIFISSPGDVAEERDGARRVIEGLQRLYPGNTLQPEIGMQGTVAQALLGRDTRLFGGVSLYFDRPDVDRSDGEAEQSLGHIGALGR